MKFVIRESCYKISLVKWFLQLICEVLLAILAIVGFPILLILSLVRNTDFRNNKISIRTKIVEEYTDEDVFMIQSDPALKLFENQYFDSNFFKINEGVFLVSYDENINTENVGMILWFLNTETLEYHNLMKLPFAQWNFKKKNNKIILFSYDNREKRILEIDIKKS